MSASAERLEHFLGLLYDHCLMLEPTYLTEQLQGMDASDAAEALGELLRILDLGAQARGAWEAVRRMPPFVLTGGVEGDAQAFTNLLFPFGSEPVSDLREPKPTDFWHWQRGQSGAAAESIRPAAEYARWRWLEMCREDPEWGVAVQRVGEAYIKLADLSYQARSRAGSRPEREHERAAEARRGRPDCGHLKSIPPCGICSSYVVSADESHFGWKRESAKLVRTPWPGVAKELDGCLCCKNGHDWRPTSSAACSICAWTVYWAERDVSARRWGSWMWLEEPLAADAADWAAQRDPKVEDKLSAAWVGWNRAWIDPREAEVARLGTNPWSYASWLELGLLPAGTFYLPVRWLRSDTKLAARERIDRVFDELWTRLKIPAPKNTALTPRRQRDWDRYLSWLWQRRIERREVADVENTGSLHDPDEDVDPRQIRRGVNLALGVLSGL